VKLLATLAALSILFLGGPSRAQAGSPSDRATISALYDQFVRAFEKKDLDGVMAVYVRDRSLFVFDVLPPREYTGWDAYRGDYKAFFAAVSGPLSERVSELQITVVGDVAYAHGIGHISGRLKPSGRVDLALRFTDVWRKMHGRWLIVHEHLSVPIDLATGKAVMH